MSTQKSQQLRPKMPKLKKPFQPRVSVVLPTYNRENYLPGAIESVLSQTLKDFELLVLVDGSPDCSVEVAQSYEDDRIVVVLSANRGEYVEMNRGFGMARGDYVTMLHSDDRLPKSSLQKRARLLDNNPDVGCAHGDQVLIDEEGARTGRFPSSPGNSAEIFNAYLRNYRKDRGKKVEVETGERFLFHHTTAMFRRELLGTIGEFDEAFPFGGDFDWFLRLLRTTPAMRAPGDIYEKRFNHAASASVAVDLREMAALEDLILDDLRPMRRVPKLKSSN